MPRQKSRTFTEVELEFMHIVWALGEASPDDIDAALREKGRNISVGSIRNVLAIMMEKGYLARRKEGKAFRYRAKVPKDKARRVIMDNLLSSLFEGSESLVIAALLEDRELSPEEKEKIRLLLDRPQGENER
jgi:BlaI family transcriptional regulator, penicillinase repressor